MAAVNAATEGGFQSTLEGTHEEATKAWHCAKVAVEMEDRANGMDASVDEVAEVGAVAASRVVFLDSALDAAFEAAAAAAHDEAAASRLRVHPGGGRRRS